MEKNNKNFLIVQRPLNSRTLFIHMLINDITPNFHVHTPDSKQILKNKHKALTNMENKQLINNDDCNELFNLFGNKSFNEFLFEQLSIHGKQVFQVDGVTGKSETFDELLKNAKGLAASILQLGIKPGEVITVTSENRLEYSTVLLASLCTGAVFSPINPTYSPDEIVHILNITKPKIIFYSALTYRNVSLALPRLKDVYHIVSFDEVTSTGLNSIKYDTLLQTNNVGKPYLPEDDEIAVILASSGTTGLPKGVMLNFRNLKYFCSFAKGRKTMDLKKDDVLMGLLPLFHGYGYGLLISSLMFGLKFILLPKFEERLFLTAIQNYKITKMYLVPPLMVFLAKHPNVPLYDLSSVRSIGCGAAPLSPDISKQVSARLPAADIRQGYGMTESSIAVTVTPPNSNAWESVGKLSPGLQAKVVDVSTGEVLVRGQQGEICLRGPCVMAGYCRDSHSTDSTVDSDGWLHTGDIGFIDQQGYFFIVDRIKELIKYKGYQVAPAELESLLLGMAGVRDAAVVGMPNLTAGELPVAFIVREPDAELTSDSILSYINGKVSPHKKLRLVRFIDSIPRNPSGKILRRLLRDTLNSKL